MNKQILPFTQKDWIKHHSPELNTPNFLVQAYYDAQKDLIKSTMKKIVKGNYELGLLGSDFVALRKAEVALKEVKATRKNKLFIWLTVNPNPKCKLQVFLDLLDRFCKRKIFTAFTYVIEQRGSVIDPSTIGTGFHAHILLKRNLDYKPSKIFLWAQNSFKSACHVKKAECFKFIWMPAAFLQDKIDYILGGKTGEGKDVKQEADIYFREENSIPKYYGIVEDFTPRKC